MGRVRGLDPTCTAQQPLGGSLPRSSRPAAHQNVSHPGGCPDISVGSRDRHGSGSWYDPALSKVTFAELAQEWLASNPRKRETTRVRDGDVIRVHLVPLLGDLPASLLRRPHVQQVVETMEAKGLRAKTIRTNYGVLRAILSWGLEHDVIHRSPCRGIRLPEPDSTPRRIASAVDIERLVEAMPIDHRVTVLLGALGLRQAEVFGLRVASIDFLRRTLTVEHTINEVHGRFVEGRGKTTGSVRTISVPNRVLDELAADLTRTDRTSPTISW